MLTLAVVPDRGAVSSGLDLSASLVFRRPALCGPVLSAVRAAACAEPGGRDAPRVALEEPRQLAGAAALLRRLCGASRLQEALLEDAAGLDGAVGALRAAAGRLGGAGARAQAAASACDGLAAVADTLLGRL